MSNMQITLGDESIDSLISQLKKMKQDNNTVIRMDGGKGAPHLVIVHKNLKVPEKRKKVE